MTEPSTTPPFVPYVPGPARQADGPLPPPANRPPRAPDRPSSAKPVLIGVGGLVVGLVIGACAASAIAGGARPAALAAATASPNTVYVTVTVADPAPATTAPAATSPAAAVTTSPPPPPPPAAATIDDGTWTVGEDIPAGTYKATGAPDRCYWAIYKSGQNQDFSAIINNHNGGGNLRVTLKAGQDFETERCGTWIKV